MHVAEGRARNDNDNSESARRLKLKLKLPHCYITRLFRLTFDLKTDQILETRSKSKDSRLLLPFSRRRESSRGVETAFARAELRLN
jgi:hypothetical protein